MSVVRRLDEPHPYQPTMPRPTTFRDLASYLAVLLIGLVIGVAIGLLIIGPWP